MRMPKLGRPLVESLEARLLLDGDLAVASPAAVDKAQPLPEPTPAPLTMVAEPGHGGDGTAASMPLETLAATTTVADRSAARAAAVVGTVRGDFLSIADGLIADLPTKIH